MANLELLIAAWDEAQREFSIALEDLKDGDVWKRPHAGLLSIGELTGHVAYYEAVMATGPAPNPDEDTPDLPIKSPLIHRAFHYYTDQIGNPVNLNMGAVDLATELKRIHEEAKAAVTKIERDSTDLIEGRENTTWGSYLQYLGFHAAYHAGQIYSVRHLLGHATPDN